MKNELTKIFFCDILLVALNMDFLVIEEKNGIRRRKYEK